jgi:hypothetical protein
MWNNILLGRKFKWDSTAEISLDTTAEILLLRTSYFFWIKINDDKELSKRIRSNKYFEEFKNELKESIENWSSCPIDFNCNKWALVVASKINGSLNIKDLIKE